MMEKKAVHHLRSIVLASGCAAIHSSNMDHRIRCCRAAAIEDLPSLLMSVSVDVHIGAFISVSNLK